MAPDILQWEHLPFPKSLRDFQRLFKDDAACAQYLEGAKWPKGFVCPHCDAKGEPFRLATRTSVLACRVCRKQTSLTVDTVMQRTHTPLGGELDRQAIEANENASTDVSDSIHDALQAWVLAPGDIIKIVEGRS